MSHATAYDPAGKVLQTQQSANGSILRTTSATYTRAGKPETTTDAAGNTTRFGYDPLDRLVAATDPMGRTTRYAYDRLGRRISATNLAIQATPLAQQSFTQNGQRASLTDANANTTAFAYDGLDRLATTTYPGGSTEVLTYDASGNVLTRKTRAGGTPIAYTYDTLNRLIAKTPPSPWPAVSYSYDLAGRQTAVSDTGAAIAAAVPPGGSTVAYTTAYAYDRLNRPTAVSFDPVPAAASPTAGPVVTFSHSYNKANQRTGESSTDATWLGYPAAAPTTTAYTANSLNQYTAVGAVTPTYDANGNLTFDGAYTLEHDAENRMVSATDGTTGSAYAFDGRGRRKLKAVGENNVTISVTDADNREVLEYDGLTGTILRWYAYGIGPNAVLNQMNVGAGTRNILIPNLLGSIAGSYDSTGALTKFGYQPYGSGGAAPQFAYTGQRIDPETGGLYYYRARHYSTAFGRFLQPDPVGYSAGENLYLYVGNDPQNATDPSGLDTYFSGVGAAYVPVIGGVIGGGFFYTTNNKYGIPDVGIYGSGGPAVGVNESLSLTAGIQFGDLSQFQGRNINVEVQLGPIGVGAAFSPAGARTFNEVSGYNVNVGLGPSFATLSSTTTKTFSVVENIFVPVVNSTFNMFGFGSPFSQTSFGSGSGSISNTGPSVGYFPPGAR